ncbi:MAG: baseplate J/gp47 family protein [Cellvibrionaceae bacterium]
MQNHSEDFEALAKEADLPTTEAEIKQRFEALRIESELTITNTSAFGPFWRFIDAVATRAVFWLVQFLIHTVYPQSFVKTATGLALKMHAYGVKVTPKEAKRTQGVIEFTRADGVGELIVPKGYAIQTEAINGVVYSVTTTEAVTIADGQLIALIPVEAAEEGAAYNLAAGLFTVLVENLGDVAAVTNNADWITTPGADDETDDELRERVINQYSAINQWHTDTVYTAIISSFDGVRASNVFFEHDAPRGPGTANAYVMFETGNPSAEFIASVQSEITDEGNHGHGDDLEVRAMPESQHNLAVTLWAKENTSDDDKAELLSSVENFVRCAFRENLSYTATKTEPWGLFSFSVLSNELHEEFANLKNVVFDLGFISSEMDLPRLNTLTVAYHA